MRTRERESERVRERESEREREIVNNFRPQAAQDATMREQRQ